MFEDLPEFVLGNCDPTFSGSIIPSKRSDRIGSFVLSFIPPRNAQEKREKKWLCFLSLDTERKAGDVTWLSLACVGIRRCCRVSRDVFMFCFYFILLLFFYCHRSCQCDSRFPPFAQVENYLPHPQTFTDRRNRVIQCASWYDKEEFWKLPQLETRWMCLCLP